MKSFKMMKTLDVTKAQDSLASWARKRQGRPLIVTERGKPLMLLVPIEEGADIESVSLGMNPDFVALIERSRAQHKLGSGLSSDEMRAELGTRRKSERKAG
jgi:antitoxin (DNA-binding transcriptional repressor) of toxin-antitoxin stability system